MLRNIPDVIKNLLIINVLMFVGTLIMQSKGIDLNQILGMHYPASEGFEPYQMVTYMFMHGSLLHIFFNMYALVLFGSRLEIIWGPKKFLFFFLATGLGALFLHIGVNYIRVQQILSEYSAEDVTLLKEILETKGYELAREGRNYVEEPLSTLNGIYNFPMVGASGAVFGILIAFAMYFPNTELMLLFPPIPIKARIFVLLYIALELYLGYANNPGDNVAHFAHLGGALIGFILVYIWRRDRTNFY